MSVSSPASSPSESRSRPRVVLHLPDIDPARGQAALARTQSPVLTGTSSDATPVGLKIDKSRTSLDLATSLAASTAVESIDAAPIHPIVIEPQGSNVRVTAPGRPLRTNSLAAIVAFLKKPPVALTGIVVLFINLAAIIWFTRPNRDANDGNDATAESVASTASPGDIESLAQPLADKDEGDFWEEVDGQALSPAIADMRASGSRRIRPDIIVPPEEESLADEAESDVRIARGVRRPNSGANETRARIQSIRRDDSEQGEYR